VARPTIEYPWEYLNNARNTLSKFGVDLVYDEPRMSKDEWVHFSKTGKDPENKLFGYVDDRPVRNVVKYQVSPLSEEMQEEEE
jgi:hypothetical protein